MKEKINLKEDRDFFTREFRNYVDEKKLLNESTDDTLWNLLGDLKLEFDKLESSSSSITSNDINKLNKALNNLEKVMKQVLKGKGLIK